MVADMLRTVAYLNNTGVALLRKGQAREAVQTFVDGVTVLRSQAAESSACGGHTPHLDARSTQGIIAQASQRLAQSYQGQAQAVTPWNTQIVTDEESSCLTTLHHVLVSQPPPSPQPVNAIRLIWLERMLQEPVSSTSDETVAPDPLTFENLLQILASVLLYHHAVAYSCLPFLQPQVSKEVLNGAYKLLVLANSSLDTLEYQQQQIQWQRTFAASQQQQEPQVRPRPSDATTDNASTSPSLWRLLRLTIQEVLVHMSGHAATEQLRWQVLKVSTRDWVDEYYAGFFLCENLVASVNEAACAQQA